MSKGANKNDAVIEQYMQSALVKIKNLESQNHELREELNKAKNVMNKTANRFGRWITLKFTSFLFNFNYQFIGLSRKIKSNSSDYNKLNI